MLVPRYYQNETLEAFTEFFLYLKPGEKANPCAKLPPGTGKSLIIAMMIKEYVERWNVRVLVLCHVTELIEQDHAKTLDHWPESKDLLGINVEKLGQRNYDKQVVFATIHGMYKNAHLFVKDGRQPFNLIIVDEAHRIPPDGDGMYLTFFEKCREINPDVRIAGLTATDWRLGSGRICKPGNILTNLIHEVPIMDMINQGFLVRPINKNTKFKIDRSQLQIKGGEFTEESMDRVFNEQGLIQNQVSELINTARKEDRHHWIVNCVGIAHAEAFAAEIRSRGITVECLHSKVEDHVRRETIKAYRDGKTTCLVNINILSLGFDAPIVDLIGMARPTESTEIYLQQIGRGLRVVPINCPHCGVRSFIVEDNCQGCGGDISRPVNQRTLYLLDWSGNVSEHGAINTDLASPDKGKKNKKGKGYKECPNEQCGELVALHHKFCPFCETPFPTLERENKTLQRAAHDAILVEPVWFPVESHQFFVNVKKGIIQHHVYLPGKVKITNRMELESGDPLKTKKAIGFLSVLLNGDPPKTVESFVKDGYREKIPCPVEVLVTQQTGYKRLEEYRLYKQDPPEEERDDIHVQDKTEQAAYQGNTSA